MTEKKPQSTPFDEGTDQTEVISPTEKIEGETSTGTFEVPGAQNPESDTVNQETNPNTE